MEKQEKHAVQRRKLLSRGGPATLFTALVLVALVLCNLLVDLVGKQANLKVDLTAGGVYALSQESKDFLATLQSPVDVIVLSDRSTFSSINPYFAQATEVLERFSKENANIHLQYLDLVKNPNLTAKYPDKNLEPTDVIVQSGGQVKLLDINDLFNTEQSIYGYKILSSRAEQALASAILAVTSQEEIDVSVLTGHGENSVDALCSMLSDNRFAVKEQSLVTEDIDPNASLVVIASPIRDYDDQSIAKLESYLQGGEHRTILYLAGSDQPTLPKLEGWLESHGVAVDQGTVFETSPSRIFNNNPFFPAVSYAESTYSQGLAQKGLICSMPYCRPLRILEDQGVQVLLNFSQTAGVMPQTADPNWQPSKEDLRADIPAMTLSSVGTGGKLLVCGSLLSVDDVLLSSTAVNNAQFLMNILNDLSNRQGVVSILPKELGGGQLNINTAQVNFLGSVFLVALPLVILLAGLFVWLSRRKK